MSRSETGTLPLPGTQSYGKIQNPSKRYTMIATLRIPGQAPRVQEVPPGEVIPVHAPRPVGDDNVLWPLWELTWCELPKKRKGLMRFAR